MRDIPTKVDNVGDTYSAAEFNSNQDERENLVTSAGITLDPDSGPDSDKNMMAKSVAKYAAGGEYYSCSGSSPTYVLTRSGLKYPPAYFSGMQILFQASFPNTAAPQVQVGTLGVVSLVQPDGTAIPNNYLKTGHFVEALYITDRFYMINYVPNLQAMTAPRMDFKYSKGKGTNGGTWSHTTNGYLWPINNLIDNNIEGASAVFETDESPGSDHYFILPHGYKYWIEIYFSIEQTQTPDTNRVYIVKQGEAPANALLTDLTNINGLPHANSLHGFLDFKAEGSPVTCELRIIGIAGSGGNFGLAADAVGITEELYLRGSIVQTGY